MADQELSRRLDRLSQVLGEDLKALERGRLSRRAARRLARRENSEFGSLTAGWTLLGVAIVFGVLGFLQRDKWYLILMGLAFGIRGARHIQMARRRSREASAQLAASPDKDRAEALCDQLLAELKDSPQAVRDFLGKPEATVEAIRLACRQLEQRRKVLVEAVSPERMADLAQEKTLLEGRLGHLDPGTYQRATEALKLRQDLFNQVHVSSEKLESERQILLNSLESLRMRVVLAKGAGGQGASLDAVKGEVDRLSDELTAITDALKTVDRGQLEAIAPIEADQASGEAVRQKS